MDTRICKNPEYWTLKKGGAVREAHIRPPPVADEGRLCVEWIPPAVRARFLSSCPEHPLAHLSFFLLVRQFFLLSPSIFRFLHPPHFLKRILQTQVRIRVLRHSDVTVAHSYNSAPLQTSIFLLSLYSAFSTNSLSSPVSGYCVRYFFSGKRQIHPQPL